MHSRYSFTTLSVLLAGALSLGACSGGDDTPDAGGGTIKPPADSGGSTTADTGLPPGTDTGVAPDSGVDDAGPQGPCPTDYPGCRCTPDDTGVDAGMDNNPQGSCFVEGTECTPLSDDLAVCHKQCEMDADCAGYMVGNPEAGRSAALCRGGLCVEAENADEDRCRLHALGGRTMSSCRTEAQCLIFADDPPGEGVCAQTCVPNAQDPNGGCADPFPFCNPSVLNGANGPIGICSTGRRPVGARCSGGLTGLCDTGAGQLFCFTNEILDPGGQQPTFPTLGLTEGFCVEGCDPNVPACPGTTDPTIGAGTCVNLGTGMNGPVGLCSHECSEPDTQQVPSTCTSTGSLGAGTNCFPFPSLTVNAMEGTFGQIDVCLDVLTPVVDEADVIGVIDSNGGAQPRAAPMTTPPDCLGTGMNGEIFSCEQGTSCLNLGSQQTVIAACVRLCTATSTSPVAPFAVNECDATRTGGSPESVCVPFGSTATVTPDLALGFCTTGAPM